MSFSKLPHLRLPLVTYAQLLRKWFAAAKPLSADDLGRPLDCLCTNVRETLLVNTELRGPEVICT